MIDIPFGASTTADEVVGDRDLSAMRVVVTGGASGIGVETARSLARGGAEVTLAVRDVTVGRTVAADIERDTGTAVVVRPLDLADLTAVRAFVDTWTGPLDVLVNNAGVMAVPHLRRVGPGWETQFAVNHLGHHALAVGLRSALAQAAATTGEARIVSVSSSGHHASPVVFDDVHYEHRVYNPWSAYGQSKTANVLFAVEATRRWADDGISANALMPGGIMTNLQRHIAAETRAQWAEYPGLKTPQQGAATTLVAALAPDLAGLGGRYLEDCALAEVIPDDADVAPDSKGVRSWALNPEAARRLWELSAAAVGDALHD